MTSVAAYDYRGNTVAFVGTRNGKLKKVGVVSFSSVTAKSPRLDAIGCRSRDVCGSLAAVTRADVRQKDEAASSFLECLSKSCAWC